MTMPSERARALRWAGEFLREALEIAELPEELKRQVKVILRHYPSAAEIAHQAKRGQLNSATGRLFEDPQYCVLQMRILRPKTIIGVRSSH